MEKEFVPYEQALALKELGFDEPCFAIYYSKNKYFTAPLYQQTFRWFREKYFIVSYIVPRNGKYTYNIISNSIKSERNGFKTYEEAELECLKKLIEIVKNN
jgi:hypothetical protein